LNTFKAAVKKIISPDFNYKRKCQALNLPADGSLLFTLLRKKNQAGVF
jgi:hypothetical protein